MELVSTKQKQIANLSVRHEILTTLSHHMDVGWLRESYRRLNRSSSPGFDRETVAEYGEGLEVRLETLLSEAKRGSYQAPPVRRVYIPKGKGKVRPLGIPTTEDKVLQGGVKMLLEPIYEQDFHDFSHGFRPGRSQHTALVELRQEMMNLGGCWILEVDIKDFFGSMNHGKLREILDKRVRDGVIRRLLDKWLKAGILEGSQLTYQKQGSPQGSSISPLLSNIYLHDCLDHWFVSQIQPRLPGRSFMLRYADDVVMGFTDLEDARRFVGVLKKRLGKYSLSLNEEKSRLLRFVPSDSGSKTRPGKSLTFDFLGFTHYWGKSLKGNWVVKRRTAKDRLAKSIAKIKTYCRRNRHKPLRIQHKDLCLKFRGHYNYYGIRSNSVQLGKFRQESRRIWAKWLMRRGGKRKNWAWFAQLEREVYPLPQPKIYH